MGRFDQRDPGGGPRAEVAANAAVARGTAEYRWFGDQDGCGGEMESGRGGDQRLPRGGQQPGYGFQGGAEVSNAIALRLCVCKAGWGNVPGGCGGIGAVPFHEGQQRKDMIRKVAMRNVQQAASIIAPRWATRFWQQMIDGISCNQRLICAVVGNVDEAKPAQWAVERGGEDGGGAFRLPWGAINVAKAVGVGIGQWAERYD